MVFGPVRSSCQLLRAEADVSNPGEVESWGLAAVAIRGC